MKVPEDEFDKPAEINIVPMIDVIFALLTFFMLSSLFLTRAEGLPVNLPNATTSQAQQQQNKVTVTINRDGQVFLDRKPIEVKDLASAVQALKGNSPQLLVVINADRQVEHGQVITAMDALRSVEGVQLGVATQQP